MTIDVDDFLGKANDKRRELLGDLDFDEDEDEEDGPPIPQTDFTETPENIAFALEFFQG